MKRKITRIALWTSLLYGMLGALWILLSGRVLFALVPDPELRVRLEIYKGWMFVAVTALLLYLILRSQLQRWEREAMERKRAEEALHESDERFYALVEQAVDAFFVHDRNGRVRDVNRRACESLGYTKEKLLQLNVLDFEQDINLTSAQAIWDRIQPGEALTLNGRHRRRNGTTFPVEVRLGCFDLGGQRFFLGLARDVNERKKAEETIAHERQLLRTLIDLLPETFYVKDLNSRFLIANEALAKHFGKKSPSQIIGLSDADFFPAEQAAEYRAAELKVFGGEPLIDHEGKGTSPTGRVCTHLTTKVPFRDSQGRIQGLVGIGRDITGRKEAETALKESEQRLQQITSLLQEAVWLRDARTRQILYVNPVFEKISGLSSDSFLKDPDAFLNIIHPDDKEQVLRARKLCFQGQTFDMEHRIIRADGDIRWVRGHMIPARNEAGEIHRLVCALEDVTHRKLAETERQKLETQLRQSQKMEAIGQLAGGVAHDFNNILTVIQGNASLLLNPQLDPKERAGCSRQIVQAAERAASLTRQLLIFSRKQVIRPSSVDLNEVVGNMTKMLRRILGEDIVLQTNYAPNLGFIHADAGMIEQVLMNLMVNARDAMLTGGQLSITTSTEKFDRAQVGKNPDAAVGPHVCLTVRDTGCGIPKENLPRIFEPFFTTKEVGKGTGLGLATVYSIVQQHRGWITVASEINKGTTFHIYFPAVTGAHAEKEPVLAAAQLPRGTGTILVVEDELAVRVLVSNLLQRCGYTVLQAKTGVAAQEVWREHQDKIQLVLTDIIMPDGMNGYELAQQLHAAKPGLKIIYTSGYSGEVVGKSLNLVEGVNFLQKPYLPQKLLQILQDNLGQK